MIGLATICDLHAIAPKVFNSHDDFEKHFAYPVRMLAIGSLGITAAAGAGVLSYLIAVLALGRAFGYAQSLRLAALIQINIQSQ